MSFCKQKPVFLQIFHQCSVLWNTTPLYFFRSNIIYFHQRQPIKVQFFWIYECLNQNSSNCSCQFWAEKSIPLQFLHHSSFSWHITALYILSSNIFNVWQKNPIKVPILRHTSALVKICQIPHVIFQILHHSLVSWKITPLHFSRSNITYFSRKEPIKA